MATTVNQPSLNPTNKVSAGVIAGAAIALAKAVVMKFFPQYYDATVWDAAMVLAFALAGWFTKDKPNVALPDA